MTKLTVTSLVAAFFFMIAPLAAEGEAVELPEGDGNLLIHQSSTNRIILVTLKRPNAR